MFSAYLRDPLLIPPTYAHGLKSILRQEAILNQIEIDQTRQNMEEDVSFYRLVAVNCTDQQQRSEIMHSYGQMSSLVKLLRERNLKGARMLSPESRTQKMRNVYEVLKESKLVENPDRTFTEEEFYEIMNKMKENEAEEEALEDNPVTS